ncbi:MAG: DUF5103 domain-containing protein [Cyclobacteriaceae bacterium]|nr:DUF5103 domain-containing protein [Cyclobacteriaceae bacterium]
MKARIFLILITASILQCVPVQYTSDSNAGTASAGKQLLYKNHTYEKEIKTVKLYQAGSSFGELNFSPIIPLNLPNRLILEFDDLADRPDNYYARLIYCKADWTPSLLHSMDYLDEYNEFIISDYTLSLDTKINYVHYTFSLPQVKASGNYLLVVYRDPDKNDLILSRRFSVFEGAVNIFQPKNKMGLSPITGHRINFEANYRDLEVRDPYNELRATIMQNSRWDNAVYDLRPTQVREDTKQLEYNYFDNSASFTPGNEYRFFDIRSVISPGQNVGGARREASPVEMYLVTDKPREGLAYSFHRDINGGFRTENFDSHNSSHHSDYVYVFFTLEMAPMASSKIYIFGELTNWTLSPENRMYYDPNKKAYTGSLLLKQGWYDYQYYVHDDTGTYSPNHLEGDHIDTENYYDIFLYHKTPGSRKEAIVGYYQFGLNERLR